MGNVRTARAQRSSANEAEPTDPGLFEDARSTRRALRRRLCARPRRGLRQRRLAGPFDDGSGTSTSGPGHREATGSVSFELTTAGDLEFDAFRYAITGPNYAKAGSIDVSDSTTVSALIEGIPVWNGLFAHPDGHEHHSPRGLVQRVGELCRRGGRGHDRSGFRRVSPRRMASVPDSTVRPVLLGFVLLVAGVIPAIRRRRSVRAFFGITAPSLLPSRCRSTR